MNLLDIIVLMVICVMTFYGVWKGFIKQVLSIVGIIAGYIVATSYYAQLAAFIKLGDPTLSKIISFMILFLACVIVFSVLAVILNKVFKLPGLGIINTVLGGATGFLKGFLIVAVVVIILVALLSAENPLLKKSVTVPYILKGLMAAGQAVPADLRAQCQKKIDSLTKSLQTQPEKKK